MGPFTRVRASEDDAVRSASAKQSSERASRAAAAATVLGVAVVLALACVSVAAAAPVFSEVSSGREEGVGIVTGLDGAMWLTDGTFRGTPRRVCCGSLCMVDGYARTGGPLSV